MTIFKMDLDQGYIVHVLGLQLSAANNLEESVTSCVLAQISCCKEVVAVASKVYF